MTTPTDTLIPTEPPKPAESANSDHLYFLEGVHTKLMPDGTHVFSHHVKGGKVYLDPPTELISPVVND